MKKYAGISLSAICLLAVLCFWLVPKSTASRKITYKPIERKKAADRSTVRSINDTITGKAIAPADTAAPAVPVKKKKTKLDVQDEKPEYKNAMRPKYFGRGKYFEEAYPDPDTISIQDSTSPDNIDL
jgi:hypothetical protein